MLILYIIINFYQFHLMCIQSNVIHVQDSLPINLFHLYNYSIYLVIYSMVEVLMANHFVHKVAVVQIYKFF